MDLILRNLELEKILVLFFLSFDQVFLYQGDVSCEPVFTVSLKGFLRSMVMNRTTSQRLTLGKVIFLKTFLLLESTEVQINCFCFFVEFSCFLARF